MSEVLEAPVRKYGWVRELPDQRDFKYSAHPEAIGADLVLPPSIDLRSKCPPIKDQGTMGSCVSNGIAFSLEFIEMIELGANNAIAPEIFGEVFAEISRLFIYYNARILDGAVHRDDGTQIRNGIKAINRWGICMEQMWPYVKSALFKVPSQDAYLEAKKHKVLAGYKINNSKLNMLKNCLVAGFPFVFGVTLYDSFNKVKADGLVSMPDPKEDFGGGHCMTCVGYDDAKQSFIVANSWGKTWGDQGYCYIPYDYLTSFYLASDFWTIRQETK
jgi:C1A family cysteine protease